MKYRKVCGCGYETTVSKEIWTKCPECGDKTNWEFEIITPNNHQSLGQGDIKWTGTAKDGREKLLIQTKGGKFLILLIDKNKKKIVEHKMFTDRIEAEMAIFQM